MEHDSIYCDCCQSIQPLRTDDMPGDSADGKHTDARDLMCATCSFVIATVFNKKPTVSGTTPPQ